MRKTECNNCNDKNKPINETVNVDEKVYCSTCFETSFPEQKGLEGKKIEKKFDPTICASCQKDFENQELKLIGVYPHCNECEIKIKNKIFPIWVKGFFAGVIFIVIFSFFWNWKYFDAFNKIKKSNELFQKGDYSNATNLMNSASIEVPEVEDLKTLKTYYKGVEYLTKDKNDEALKEFNICKNKVPQDYNINVLILQAKIGSCFNKKDYNGFLLASKENFKIDSTSSMSFSSVASAYACIYADKGDLNAKKLALENIEKAKLIDNKSTESKFYYNFLDYRITTRQIITREEFIKKYPNGWTKN
ncbi:hypothetical protein [Flavobacterium sp.]|uniref:hypothetical protein n=1 Tax=Flavobacterium sp. TaxID=239 RepID=UPI00286BE5A9|nr:hypothetical protein [Flavobacterium sp.]